MKTAYVIIGLSALALTVLSGCRTTEKNYREAYEKTRTAIETSQEEDHALARDLGFRQDTHPYKSYHPLPVGTGDTITVYPLWLTPDKENGVAPEQIKAYSVASARLKQKFNARNIAQRLGDNGFPGTFTASDPAGDMVVVVGSFNEPAQAKKMLDSIAESFPLPFKDNFPIIIENPRSTYRRR